MVFPVIGEKVGGQGVIGPPELTRTGSAADLFLALLGALLGGIQRPRGAESAVGEEHVVSVHRPSQGKREAGSEMSSLAGAPFVLGAIPERSTFLSGEQAECSGAVQQGAASEMACEVPADKRVADHAGLPLPVPQAAGGLSKVSVPGLVGDEHLAKVSSPGHLAVSREQSLGQSQGAQASAGEGLRMARLPAASAVLEYGGSDRVAATSIVRPDPGVESGRTDLVDRSQGLVPREIPGARPAGAVEHEIPPKGLLSAAVSVVSSGGSGVAAEYPQQVTAVTPRKNGEQHALHEMEPVGSLFAAAREGAEQATVRTSEPAHSVDPRAQVEERVLEALERGVRQVRVRLEPPELGVVDVRVREVSGRLEVILAAGNPEVRQALEHGREGLRIALVAGGFSLQRLEIQPLAGSSGQNLLGGAPNGGGWSGGQQGTSSDPNWTRGNVMLPHLPSWDSSSEQEHRQSFQSANLVDTWA